MDHQFIDQHDVAGRYLRHQLPPAERDDFEAHLVDCAECADRMLLAELFEAEERAAQQAVPVPVPAPQPAVPHPAPMRLVATEAMTPAVPSPPLPTHVVAPRPSRTLGLSEALRAPERTAEQVPEAASQPAQPRATIEPVHLPLRARIVAYLSPWQLAGLVLVLVMVPLALVSLLFLWELQQLRPVP